METQRSSETSVAARFLVFKAEAKEAETTGGEGIDFMGKVEEMGELRGSTVEEQFCAEAAALET